MTVQAISALKLAGLGFYIFPIVPGQKTPPAFKGWQDIATRDPLTIQDWWIDNPHYNIGIFTGKFQDNLALVVIDVDNKNGGVGDGELLRLKSEGRELPDTFMQTTPTGGHHIVFSCHTPVRQGTSVLGRNLDIRSAGGYIVGAGSMVDAGQYSAIVKPVAQSPEWVLTSCGLPRIKDDLANTLLPGVNAGDAHDRAVHYLKHDAPLAIQGAGGDETTYKVAAKLKDFGVVKAECLSLMDEHWNNRCSPPWDFLELNEKILHAYKYGLKPVGSSAPEIVFQPATGETPGVNGTPHPFQLINQQYAFVLAGGGAHILWETTDATDRKKLEHLAISAFHQKFAPYKMQLGRTEHQISELWLESKERRQFDGLVFMPGQQEPPRFYNLWKGFSYAPSQTYTPHPAVEAFIDHARRNVCGDNETLFKWLIGYFAHLVQRPWEKPLVSLVFRGSKGVGKNALIERVGSLLGGHFLLTSNRRYLIGNFNGHLENCLLFALDEAFWSGDKQAEGTLKDLITGREHVIEHKGKEPFTVANKTRVVIIGNEDWLVPASYDERRFAVFHVGTGNKQDRQFFENMRTGMEQRGGYQELLRYLLDFPISEVNAAPKTKALDDQIINSLHPFHQWWLECLDEARIVGMETNDFPAEVHCDRFRSAFRRYSRDRNIKRQIPDDRVIGKLLKECAPAVGKRRMNKVEDGSQPYMYTLRGIAEHRAEWDTFIGHPGEWL